MIRGVVAGPGGVDRPPMQRLRVALLIPVGVVGFVLFPAAGRPRPLFTPGWALPAARRND
jgi:hypothetical protein